VLHDTIIIVVDFSRLLNLRDSGVTLIKSKEDKERPCEIGDVRNSVGW